MEKNWKEFFNDKLEFLGHRNWIIVVDKAYPLQNSDGMIVLNSQEELPDVLKYVFSKLSESKHIRPVVYFDKELKVLDDSYCPGISDLRSRIFEIIEKSNVDAVHEMIHEEIIYKLEKMSKSFTVIVIKTEALLPYTSVFVELDCGYWMPNQEEQLRSSI